MFRAWNLARTVYVGTAFSFNFIFIFWRYSRNSGILYLEKLWSSQILKLNISSMFIVSFAF